MTLVPDSSGSNPEVVAMKQEQSRSSEQIRPWNRQPASSEEIREFWDRHVSIRCEMVHAQITLEQCLDHQRRAAGEAVLARLGSDILDEGDQNRQWLYYCGRCPRSNLVYQDPSLAKLLERVIEGVGDFPEPAGCWRG